MYGWLLLLIIFIIIIKIEFVLDLECRDCGFYYCVSTEESVALFTFPSVVTAAKTVEEYGAQATSVTAAPISNSKVNMGDLWETCIVTCISYYSVKTKL